MLFNSPQFILLFLPISVIIYFLLTRLRLIVAAKGWLILSNLFFYGYWNALYLPLLLGSMLINYVIGVELGRAGDAVRVARKPLLISGIALNLGALAYFKYTDFLLSNVNLAVGTQIPLTGIILPLAISFFTFQQIAYLVDSYRRETTELDFVNYLIFVSFFPQLIAGPIVHHSEMMPQFRRLRNAFPRFQNIAAGCFIFSIGLFKKVVIADTFAVWATAGFDGGQVLGFWTAWATSLSYTFQLYFDFSGYCDMAIGAALLFNIRLPINFNSPYRALDIQDFWRRWHITLSRFLRDYLYVPLGGNRCSTGRVYMNLMATFVLGGLWHGASWMFIIWGALHGAALVLHRVWRSFGYRMPVPLAWLTTFLFVNFCWVFFRAETMDDATRILVGMGDVGSVFGSSFAGFPASDLTWGGTFLDQLVIWIPAGLAVNFFSFLAIIAAFLIVFQPNGVAMMDRSMTLPRMGYAAVLFALGLYASISATSSVFLYFNF